MATPFVQGRLLDKDLGCEIETECAAIRIGVGGCVASQEGDAIHERAPFVDLVFGPQTLHRLPEMLNQSRANSVPVVDISFPEIEKFDRLPEPSVEGPSGPGREART